MKIDISTYLRQQPRFHILLLCVALVILIAVLERMFEGDVTLAIAYLVPVALAAIPLGKWGGIMISLASALTVVAVEVIEIGGKFPSSAVYINAGTVLGSLAFITVLLSKVKVAFAEEWKQARTDQLTGLSNLSHSLEMAADALSEARLNGKMITVAALTLDNLKELNAEKGSKWGDAILASTGELIKRVLRGKDFAGRHESNRFMIVFPNTGTKGSGPMIRRIEQHMTALINRNGWSITFSIGAVTFALLPADVEEMRDLVFKLADATATPGKHSVKHEIVMKTDEMSANSVS